MSRLNPAPALKADVHGPRAVGLYMEGKSHAAIANVLSLEYKQPVSANAVSHLLNSEKCMAMKAAISDTFIVELRRMAKHKGAHLLPKAVEVIEHHLKKNSLIAAGMVLKLAGVDEADGKSQDMNISVIFPSAEGGPRDVTIPKEEASAGDKPEGLGVIEIPGKTET